MTPTFPFAQNSGDFDLQLLRKLMDEQHTEFIEINVDAMPSFLQETTNRHWLDFEIKRNEFIQSKIIEKGFGALIETLSHRFPKLCQIRQREWTLWYADNGTVEGEFIFSIKDAEFKMSEGDNLSAMATLSCTYSETLPIHEPLQHHGKERS